MTQLHSVGQRATSIYQDTGHNRFMTVRYHATDVVKWNEKLIVLKSGGWLTATTRTRMNQAANQFDLGYRVFQKNFKWYVQHKGKTLDFEDNMILKR